MTHCFVCLGEEDPLYQMCSCNMLVHEHCLRKLTQDVTTHSTKCPICLTPYPGKVFRLRSCKLVIMDNFSCLFVALSGCSLAFAALASVLPFERSATTLGLQTFFGVTSVLAFMVVLSYTLVVSWKLRRLHCCIGIRSEVVQKSVLRFPLPTEQL